VTLVLEEDEKVKQKQERLSRMGSTRSSITRMTSVKSTYSRSAVGRDLEREHRRLRAVTNVNSLSDGSRSRKSRALSEQLQDREDREKGLADAEGEEIIMIENRDLNLVNQDYINDNSNRRREMLSVIGESGENSSRISTAGFNRQSQEGVGDQTLSSQSSIPQKSNLNQLTGEGGEGEDSTGSVVAATSSTPLKSGKGSNSTNDPFSSPTTATNNSNPFASPPASSNGRTESPTNFTNAVLTPAPPLPSPPIVKTGLGRKLSEVVRLRSPVPPRSTNSTNVSSNASSGDAGNRISPTTKVSTDTFGVKANSKTGSDGTQSQPEQTGLSISLARTSTSSNRSKGSLTTQMIGNPSTTNMVASPIRSYSVDAGTHSPEPNPVGGSEWTYVSKAQEWRPKRSLDRDYLSKDPNPLGLSYLNSSSNPNLPLPKGIKNGADLKRATSIGVAGSRFKETFDDSP